jgi:hypothetical protein
MGRFEEGYEDEFVEENFEDIEEEEDEIQELDVDENGRIRRPRRDPDYEQDPDLD